MPVLLIRHRVADYPAWKHVFDEQGGTRWSNGCRGGQVFRNPDDPAEVWIFLTWDDLLRARLYAQSDEMRESITSERITDESDVWVLEHIDDAAN